jgi:chloramphenicol 3-O-phosphotransferase
MAVGKTTVAITAQRLLPDPWLLYEVDGCQPHVPPKAEFVTLDNDRRLRQANLQAARAYVDAGFNVIIEMGLTDDWGLAAYQEVFEGVPSLLVVLTAERDMLLDRAARRGSDLSAIPGYLFDPPSEAALSNGVVIDTSDEEPMAVARRVVELVARG